MSGVALGIFMMLACLASGCNKNSSAVEVKKMATATMTMAVSSKAFENGGMIPRKYTGEGENVSPPLVWDNVPNEVMEFALIMDDPDAPGRTFDHWLLYGIPASLRGLDEAISSADGKNVPPEPMRQGKNSADMASYMGPMPPPGHGVHHYHFKLFALDKHLNLPGGLTKAALINSIQGHVLAEGEIIGLYER